MNQLKEHLRALLESPITADEAWWELKDSSNYYTIFSKKMSNDMPMA